MQVHSIYAARAPCLQPARHLQQLPMLCVIICSCRFDDASLFADAGDVM
jgi:hypothetical protein